MTSLNKKTKIKHYCFIILWPFFLGINYLYAQTHQCSHKIHFAYLPEINLVAEFEENNETIMKEIFADHLSQFEENFCQTYSQIKQELASSLVIPENLIACCGWIMRDNASYLAQKKDPGVFHHIGLSGLSHMVTLPLFYFPNPTDYEHFIEQWSDHSFNEITKEKVVKSLQQEINNKKIIPNLHLCKKMITAHELGHALFEANYQMGSLEKNLIDKMKNISAMDLFYKSKEVNNNTVNALHLAQLLFVEFDLINPYHEFFADLVEVLVFNPQSLHVSQQQQIEEGYPENEHLSLSPLYRSFNSSNTASADQWENIDDPHFQLAPARAFLASTLQAMSLNQGNKGKVLRAILRASEKSIQHRLNNDLYFQDILLEGMPPFFQIKLQNLKKVNEDFIHFIQQELNNENYF